MVDVSFREVGSDSWSSALSSKVVNRPVKCQHQLKADAESSGFSFSQFLWQYFWYVGIGKRNTKSIKDSSAKYFSVEIESITNAQSRQLELNQHQIQRRQNSPA